MNKHLLLILLGFGSFGVSADDGFPIELTCEIGANIVYFNLNETKVGSWWKPHFSHSFGSKFTSTYFNNKAFKDKKNTNFKNYKFNDGQISFHLTGANTNAYVSINRFSLKITDTPNASGQCYKGFKEYEKQI